MLDRSAVALCLILVAAPAWADVLVLKDGERVEGIVEERGSEVEVRLDYGVVGFPKSEVARIERTHTALSALEAKHAALRPGDAEALYRLGLEAEKLEQRNFAATLYREVIALVPDHRGARAALGYRQHQGRWMTGDEFMAAEGYVKRSDRWVTPEAAAAIDRAEAEAERARAQEAELRADRARVAALEARVAQAEADAKAASERAERADGGSRAAGFGWGFAPVWSGGAWRVAKTPAPAPAPTQRPSMFGSNAAGMQKLTQPIQGLPPPGSSAGRTR